MRFTRESKVNILFETRDRTAAGAWLHRSYIRKKSLGAKPSIVNRA